MSDYSKRTIAHDPVVQTLVRYKAHKYRLRAGLPAQDEEDVAQALFAGLLERFAGLDQNREHALGFVIRVLNQIAANLRRDCHAAKRDDRGVTSLDARGGAAGQAAPADAVTKDNLEARSGGRSRSAEDLADLKSDVALVLDAQSPELRALADQLMIGSLADAARHTGEARSTLAYRRMRLRAIFEQKNLQEYL